MAKPTKTEQIAAVQRREVRQSVVYLEVPIQSGIDKITLREPRAGDLRGIKLSSLGDDIETSAILVPRVADPTITSAEFNCLVWSDAMRINRALLELMTAKN